MKYRRKSKTAILGAALDLVPSQIVSASGFMLFALAILVFSTAKPEVFTGLRAQIISLTAPVVDQLSIPFVAVSNMADSLFQFTDLRAENERLKAENERLQEWYRTSLALQAENKSLKALLKYEPEPDIFYTSARIISDPGQSYVRSVIVRAGSHQGIEKGQAVLSGNGVAGRVIDVTDEYARILLATDMNSRIPVIIEDSQVHAVLAGQNNAAPVLLHLPGESVIQRGARVLTSGMGGIFPPGLLVGTVGGNQGNQPMPSVKLATDMSKLLHVRIIGSKGSAKDDGYGGFYPNSNAGADVYNMNLPNVLP